MFILHNSRNVEASTWIFDSGRGKTQTNKKKFQPFVSASVFLSASHWYRAALDGMGVAERLGWVLGVCPVMMSCVTLSILLYELLCISQPQSGLLSLPSIIHNVSLELAYTHTQTHTVSLSFLWKACKSEPVITPPVLLLLPLPHSRIRIILNKFDGTTLQTLITGTEKHAVGRPY